MWSVLGWYPNALFCLLDVLCVGVCYRFFLFIGVYKLHSIDVSVETLRLTLRTDWVFPHSPFGHLLPEAEGNYRKGLVLIVALSFSMRGFKPDEGIKRKNTKLSVELSETSLRIIK